MIQNYFRLALRNLLKNPLFTFLNMTGLAVGLAAAAFIGLFILSEWQTDRFLPVEFPVPRGPDNKQRTTNNEPWRSAWVRSVQMHFRGGAGRLGAVAGRLGRVPAAGTRWL